MYVYWDNMIEKEYVYKLGGCRINSNSLSEINVLYCAPHNTQ